jgi:hypothetical protein
MLGHLHNALQVVIQKQQLLNDARSIESGRVSVHLRMCNQSAVQPCRPVSVVAVAAVFTTDVQLLTYIQHGTRSWLTSHGPDYWSD